MLAAALLHDIGHYPFSHAIEELGYPIEPHERVGRRIIEQGAVAAALERHGLSPQRVADVIDPPRDRPLPPTDAILVRLLSGPLDVDKLDYLPRDARGCNVPYGGVDLTRLLGSIRLLRYATGAAARRQQQGHQPAQLAAARPPGDVRQRLLAPHQPRDDGDAAAGGAGGAACRGHRAR